ncbi:hypothetical protein PG994_003894 [Apiospora phragmitis]|uniref:Uncharacterized protein n=1 Tax=Apiospora phragmitis TaxID=2905665 RepID=A0ABR1VZE4_9PEZI
MMLETTYPLPAFFEEGDAEYQISFSNWTTADLFDADFQLAMVKYEECRGSSRSNSYNKSENRCHSTRLQFPFEFLECFLIMEKYVRG